MNAQGLNDAERSTLDRIIKERGLLAVLQALAGSAEQGASVEPETEGASEDNPLVAEAGESDEEKETTQEPEEIGMKTVRVRGGQYFVKRGQTDYVVRRHGTLWDVLRCVPGAKPVKLTTEFRKKRAMEAIRLFCDRK